MSNYTHNLIMNGTGSDQVQIPAGYPYMSIINNTDNTIHVFQERRSTLEPEYALIKVPAYTQQTIPITTTRRDFTFFYLDGGGAGTKKAEVIFSVENLQIQGTLGTAISGTVTIGADGVGLARQEQLPAALTAGGNLKVAIEEGTMTGVDMISDQLPAALTGGGNLKVALQEQLPVGSNKIGSVDVDSLPALPAGTNNIGDVDVLTLPDVNRASKTAVKVTAGGSGDQTVKASAGKVHGIVGATASVTLKLKDATTERWLVLPQTQSLFPTPITCGTSIVLNFSGAGDAYIIYE